MVTLSVYGSPELKPDFLPFFSTWHELQGEILYNAPLS
jgi:hypothetical protein